MTREEAVEPTQAISIASFKNPYLGLQLSSKVSLAASSFISLDIDASVQAVDVPLPHIRGRVLVRFFPGLLLQVDKLDDECLISSGRFARWLGGAEAGAEEVDMGESAGEDR